MKRVLTIALLGLALSGFSCQRPVTEKQQPEPIIESKNINFYLPVDQKSTKYAKALVPANSKILACGEYLTLRNGLPIPYLDKAEALQSALSQQLMMKIPADNFYYNPLIEHAKIRIDSVIQAGDVINVSLVGDFTSTGDKCGDQAIKGMIQETIKEYTQKYTVKLNSSESNWQCLFNDSEACK